MKSQTRTRTKRGGISALLLVSLFILVTDACFIWINYHSDRKALVHEQRQRGEYVHKAFALALSTVATTMQQIATMVAHDPRVQELFLQGRMAVELEGGGPGGEQAARIRQALYAHLEQVWGEMADRYDVRQLHFHLPPGSLSFLRVHKPEKFGDTMHDVRFTIVDANDTRLPVKGFETGRVYSGIRGVAPVFARDPETGDRVHVGALEAGTSFETLLQDLSRTFDARFAVLLGWEHVKRNMWQPDLLLRFPDGAANGWVVEQGPPAVEELLHLPAIRELLAQQKPDTRLLLRLQPPLAVDSFPLQDYRGAKEGLQPVGRLLEWRDITQDVQAFNGMLTTNIIYGLAGFILVELLLLTAWRAGSAKLSSLVRQRTEELQQTSAQLGQEVQVRKQAEQALAERARQYRSMFDDNSCAMLLVDPEEGRIVRANQAAASFYGYDKDLLESMTIFQINTLPEHEVRASMQRTAHTRSIRHEFSHRLADGSTRIVAVHSGPVTFDGRQVLFSIIHDITDIRTTQQQLREALEEHEAIFENSQVGVVMLRGGRTVARVNQHFCELLGYEQDEVVGQGVEIFHISEHHFEEFGRLHYESLRSGVRRQIEFPLRRKDGSSVWCLISGKAISPPDLDKGVIWVASDITVIKEAERMREDVQRIMRHDLKTPLNSIMGVPQLLKLDGQLTPDQLELVNHLEGSARRMLSLIDLSLDLSRMESGTYTLKPVPVDLVEVLGNVDRELADIRSRKMQTCACTLDGRPLMPGDAVWVLGEDRLCYTVLANLLRNAYEAAPSGSAVSVAFTRQPNSLQLQMSNEGCVPPELRETFFDKYATAGKDSGTGLGTYSARLAVEVQKGAISMHCHEGRTVLTLTLPASQPAPAA